MLLRSAWPVGYRLSILGRKRLLTVQSQRTEQKGNRMTPSHARKGGIKYRYYLSSPLLHRQPGHVGSVRRVPAAEIEALVGCAVREHLGDPTESEDRDLIRNH